MSQSDTVPKQQLENAFQQFNQLSEQLMDSYRLLEDRVAHLNTELANAHSDRLRQLAEKERLANRLRNLLDALPGGVVVVDGRGLVQDGNPVATDLLGEPLVGEAWRDVIGRAFAPRSDDGHDVSLRDGRRVNISTCPLADEPGQILLLQDVTETRALQERFSRHKRLSAMGEMAASLAHQIRTPLSAAILYVSHLGKGPAASAEVAATADKIMARLRHLETLVKDMLVFARGGSGGAESVDVDDLLEHTYLAVEPLLVSGGCQMTVLANARGGAVQGNREALLGALQNLIANAIQACGPGGQLQLSSEWQADGWLRIGVRDTGPGIAPELREKLFEPFFTTRSQGTGLGLAVVQAVAQTHQGQAWCESVPGQGSCFGMDLPVHNKGAVQTVSEAVS
jgi:two-component system sensor histidine kinase FlrB